MTFSIEKIDEEKIRIEASVVPKIKKIFANMAEDAETIYRTTGRVPEELAENYYPEFLKEVRDAMRKTIKKFGFDLRSSLEAKHGLFFDAEFKKTLVEIEFKKLVKIVDENIDPKLEKINNDLLSASTFFVANQSEAQASFITATNSKELTLAAQQEEILFADNMGKMQSELNDLLSKEPNTIGSQQTRIRQQIEASTRQIRESERNFQAIIAKNIKINLLDRSQARSELIASQNVGMAESWSRQTEAKLINDANLVTSGGNVVTVIKTWFARLDSRTRAEHVAADLQQVPVNQTFMVGGESLLYPRDPNGSSANVINCRCVADYSSKLETVSKSFKSIETYKPTEEMARNAARGLEWREKYGRGGTAVGVARANQLKNRENLSERTVKRMHSYFSRHGNYRSSFYEFRDGEPTTWRIAWELWGGDVGRDWASRIAEKLRD